MSAQAACSKRNTQDPRISTARPCRLKIRGAVSDVVSRAVRFAGWCVLVGCLAFAWNIPRLMGQGADFDGEPIRYSTAAVHDRVARLVQEIESGDRKLEYHPERGYLDAVLRELEVPVSSQVLVFSKTSMQVHRISPHRPRAVYFSDDVYVGYCQKGDVLEIASVDPVQGPIFYSVRQKPDDRPSIARDQGQCIVCHASSRTQNVPGLLVRSVFVNKSGHPNFGSGTFTTDATSPFERRWGGWYVTGTHGRMRHMGNAIFEENQREAPEGNGNRMSLDGLVSTSHYLAPHSDIVALMVLEHQTQMQNAITWANFETRMALHQSETMNEVLGRESDYVSDIARRRIDRAADRVVEHLLMVNEFALTDEVKGTSPFAEEFEARGLVDGQGRHLRKFNLKTRLFEYPCSYMIYSQSFDALPEIVRARVYARLHDVLTGRDTSATFQHLTETDREAIHQILIETRTEYRALSDRSETSADVDRDDDNR